MAKLNKKRRWKRAAEKVRLVREAAMISCPKCHGKKTQPFTLATIRQGGYLPQGNPFSDLVVDCDRCKGSGKVDPA